MENREPSRLTDEQPGSGLHFLAGGGEMGRLIRGKDWSATPLEDLLGQQTGSGAGTPR